MYICDDFFAEFLVSVPMTWWLRKHHELQCCDIREC